MRSGIRRMNIDEIPDCRDDATSDDFRIAGFRLLWDMYTSCPLVRKAEAAPLGGSLIKTFHFD
jgi:hypothetical protein